MSNQRVTDEVILEGFRSLHEAMAVGFDRLERKMDERFAGVDRRFEAVDRRFAQLEARVMRRFDAVD